MRNPLKRIQKKINFRLKSSAAQHSKDVPLKSHGKKKHGSTSSLSHTSQEADHEDPAYVGQKTNEALSERNNIQQTKAVAPKTTPKKKKKGPRISFGSRKTQSISSIPAQTNETADPAGEEKASSSRRFGNLSPRWGPHVPSPRPPAQDRSKDEEASSPISPSAEEQIPAPPFMDDSTSRQELDNKHEQPPSAPPASYQTPPRHKPQKHKAAACIRKEQPQPETKPQPVTYDPNLERIARAAAALDNTGNELFEKGEYDKAMANYIKALKLKNRTLINVQMEELQASHSQNWNAKEEDTKEETEAVTPTKLSRETLHQSRSRLLLALTIFGFQ
jgi:hypothetical protein